MSHFKSTIWHRELLRSLRNKYVATPLYNTNYEGDISSHGQTVKIHRPGSITVSDYVVGTDMAVQKNPTGTDLELTIDQQKSFNFTIDDILQKQSAVDLINGYSDEAAYALRDAAEKHILSTIAAGADSDNVVTVDAGLSTSDIYDNIAKLKKILSKNNVPLEGRSIMLTPDEIELLETCDEFKSASDLGDDTKRNGFSGRICGFDVFETLNLKEDDPATVATGDPVHRYIVASYQGATTHAEQLVKVKQYEAEKQFAMGVKGLHVYGTKVIRPTGIAVLKVKYTVGTM